MAEKSPLIEALPPATDYLTYLTVIEYNLTVETLPTLHEVLQDAKLTTNIGWDLVHLLLPLLPASQQCLQDVARLGNPREVILKVTECLRLIDFQGLESDDDDDDDAAPHITMSTSSSKVTQAVEVLPTPLPIDQFLCLMSMLSILHPRIQTQYPSRFLSTSLQAVLYAFSQSTSHREELLSAVVRFIKDVNGTKRPHLPPRKSSSTIDFTRSTDRGPDPEPDTGPDGPLLSESDMQLKLFQALVTFLLENYMLSLKSEDDVPGLSWSSRLAEKLHPERSVPGRESYADKFEKDTALYSRLTAVGEILALSQDLGISTGELLSASQAPEAPYIRTTEGEDAPPKSAADVPLSKAGSLFLYAARVIGKALYSGKAVETPITIFPVHQALLKDFVGESTHGSTIGMEPEALLDTLLVLGLQAVELGEIGQPKDTDSFYEYLQSLSLLSSNCPSPSLRYVAYFLTTTVLRSNPSDIERLAFIKDTLEHCPLDNLKVAAVSWIKGETIEANAPDIAVRAASRAETAEADEASDQHSIFATPIALDSLAPHLFPDLSHDLTQPDLGGTWETFDSNLNFYLAVLNFYFLLLSAGHLKIALRIGQLHANNDIGGSFIGPLRQLAIKFTQAAAPDGELGKRWSQEGDVNIELARLKLLESTLEKVEAQVSKLDQSSAGS